MPVRVISCAFAATLLTISSGCNRVVPDKQTIQECVALLPKGDLYMLEIRGVIDTGATPPAIEGGFEIMAEGATRDEMEAFSLCMKAVIQPRTGEEPSLSTSAPAASAPDTYRDID